MTIKTYKKTSASMLQFIINNYSPMHKSAINRNNIHKKFLTKIHPEFSGKKGQGYEYEQKVQTDTFNSWQI